MSPIIKRTFRLREAGLILLSFLLLWSGGCTIRQAGCLDLAARNFDLDADKPCDGCCEYPVLSLVLTQKWDSMNFSLDSIYLDRNGMPFKFRDLRYMLSSFVLTDTDDELYTIDSTEIQCNTEVIKYTPDQLIIEPRKFSYAIDSFQYYPFITSVGMKLGWDPALACVDPSGNAVPDILSKEIPLWDSVLVARSAVRLIIQRDLGVETFDTIYVHTCKDILLDYDYEFVPGSDTRLDISVDYAIWFQNADITDLQSFRTSILEKAQSSFTRTP